MSERVLDQSMFNVIDNLTDINQLTDNIFNNEQNDNLNESEFSSDQTASKNKYQKLTTPNLEDSASNLSLLDHTLTDEEIFKYLSLFSENNFQLVDELDIENTIQPCSSINSNATTVSTQETNEFRESLLNFDINGDNNQANNEQQLNNNESSNENREFNSNEANNYQVATSVVQTNCNDQMNAGQANISINQASQQTSTNQLVNYNVPSKTNFMNTSNMMNNNDLNEMNNCQLNQTDVSQSNLMRSNNLMEYNNNQSSANYYYSNQMNNQMSNQLNQFQCANNSLSTCTNNNLQMNFLNNNNNSNLVSNNCLPNNLIDITSSSTINYCDMNNTNTFTNNSSSNYLPNNEYYTFTECRDVNCPYTYCSRYNPYNPYSNNFMSFRNQFRPSFTNDACLTDQSINMNLVDNQIVFNKNSDNVFNSIAPNQTNNKTTKRTAKRKQTNKEFTETSVICNESTDYTFYTLEENLQSKRKRGRKKKSETILELKNN